MIRSRHITRLEATGLVAAVGWTAAAVIGLAAAATPTQAALIAADSYNQSVAGDAQAGLYVDKGPLANFNPQGGSVVGFGGYASNSSSMFYVTGPGLTYSDATMQTIGSSG